MDDLNLLGPQLVLLIGAGLIIIVDLLLPLVSREAYLRRRPLLSGLALLAAAGFDSARARAAVLAGTRRQAGLETTRPADVSLDASRARGILRVKLRGPPRAAPGRAGRPPGDT